MKAIEVNGTTINDIEIENTLKALQQYVEGYIEAVTLVPGEVAMIVNEEGLLRGMQLNQLATVIASRMIVGPALIVGIDDEEFCDIPEEVKRTLHIRYGGGK